MNDFQRVLDATEQHLLTLKSSGVRFLTVEPSTLVQLREPPPPFIEAAIEPERNGHAEPDVENTPPAAAAAQPEDLEAAMADLCQRASVCLKCPHLVSSRKNVVFGVGSIRARLMFVGEAPGADEDARGEPFVGAAGQLLTRIIQTMGLSRETVYIANILKCRPDTPGQSSGNRKPTADEMKTCLPYLLAQIDVIRPKVLVALGATAIEGLLGATGGIGKVRGHFQTFRDIPLMPTFHPAYLLHTQAPSEKRKVWEDMLLVMEKLQMPISEKQRGYFKS
ncbi:MAG TPA: uracil-DNA glycosylase [Verrucomicrobiae bacterium]|jgi:DNA polymerase